MHSMQSMNLVRIKLIKFVQFKIIVMDLKYINGNIRYHFPLQALNHLKQCAMAKLGGRKIATGVAASEEELLVPEGDVQDVQGQL